MEKVTDSQDLEGWGDLERVNVLPWKGFSSLEESGSEYLSSFFKSQMLSRSILRSLQSLHGRKEGNFIGSSPFTKRISNSQENSTFFKSNR